MKEKKSPKLNWKLAIGIAIGILIGKFLFDDLLPMLFN